MLPPWLERFRRSWVSPAEVRSETWALGARHAGRVCEGARIELGARPLSARRAVLLKAVLRAEALKALRS